MTDIIQLSSRKFIFSCAIAAGIILFFGKYFQFTPLILGAEVLATILSLFLFGSMRYQIDKNALTYGSVLIISASFLTLWWPTSFLRTAFQNEGSIAGWNFARLHFFSLHSLDELVHADTMLFILGLTFFVSVIAQTRILESVSFAILKKNKGYLLPTVAILTALVSAASGVLDGVSMIGLMIRTLVIILFLAKAKDDAVIFAVIVSTVITTVCGMWLAYGEPPNLIMKANLHPYLTNGFFLRYCLPAAVGSYAIVFWNLRGKLRGKNVSIENLDVLDLHTADVRFLQASRHGEVFTPIEFIEEKREMIAPHFEDLVLRLQQGEPLGEALIHEKVSPDIRKKILGGYVSEELSETLDRHYDFLVQGIHENVQDHFEKVSLTLEDIQKKRVRTQWVGAVSFLPFVGLLIWHGMDHTVPLFWASFTGFIVAYLGILSFPQMSRLALRDAFHECKEYLFLFPLFFSITLLQKSGFFEGMTQLLHQGIEKLGISFIAFIQFTGACFLSALLDNNVVADFASRALHGLEIGVLHLFAMAQIAGYAAGGCWTHIGSAQSVVAYAFIRREVDARYTPFQWIKSITPVILEIFALMALIIVVEGSLLRFFTSH